MTGNDKIAEPRECLAGRHGIQKPEDNVILPFTVAGPDYCSDQVTVYLRTELSEHIIGFAGSIRVVKSLHHLIPKRCHAVTACRHQTRSPYFSTGISEELDNLLLRRFAFT